MLRRNAMTVATLVKENIKGGLQFRGSVYYYRGGALQCAGRYSTGEVGESPTSCMPQEVI